MVAGLFVETTGPFFTGSGKTTDRGVTLLLLLIALPLPSFAQGCVPASRDCSFNTLPFCCSPDAACCGGALTGQGLCCPTGTTCCGTSGACCPMGAPCCGNRCCAVGGLCCSTSFGPVCAPAGGECCSALNPASSLVCSLNQNCCYSRLTANSFSMRCIADTTTCCGSRTCASGQVCCGSSTAPYDNPNMACATVATQNCCNFQAIDKSSNSNCGTCGNVCSLSGGMNCVNPSAGVYTCAACAVPNCSLWSGSTPCTCTGCASGYQLVNNQCVEIVPCTAADCNNHASAVSGNLPACTCTCESGFGGAACGIACTAMAGCVGTLACSSVGSSTCSVCDAAGFYHNPTTAQCVACASISHCLSAPSCAVGGVNDCTACADGYYLVDGLPDTCTSCPSLAGCVAGAERCSSVNDVQCVQCAEGFVLQAGLCVVFDCVLTPSLEWVLLGEMGAFPGQRIQVTMHVVNGGTAGLCTGIIRNTVPAGLGYLAGTIVVNNDMQPQTDAVDSDLGSYNAATAEVTVSPFSLLPGAHIRVTFQAEIGCFTSSAVFTDGFTVERVGGGGPVLATSDIFVNGLPVVNECTLQATFVRECGANGGPCMDYDTATCGGVTCGPCPVGFEADGNGVCVDPNACAQIVCPDVNAYCVDGLGTYTCLCSEGYHDENGVCVLDVTCVAPAGECNSADTLTLCCAGYVCSDIVSPGVLPATCVQGLECAPGSYQSGQECVACPGVTGCLAADVRCTTASNAYCEDCEPGFFLNEQYSCTPCQDVPGCQSANGFLRCTSATDAICDACVSGWYIDENLHCSQCPEIPGCAANAGFLACTQPGDEQCTGCNNGWYIDNGRCSQCPEIPGCDAENGFVVCTQPGDEQCTGCNDGWYLDNGRCSPCTEIPGCDAENGFLQCSNSENEACYSCYSGWHLVDQRCVQDDPCALIDCGVHSHCVEGVCVCDAGYASNGGACLNINDCATVECGSHAHCVDGLQTYTCVCDAGYASTNGGPCEAITPTSCAVNNGNCGSHADCYNGQNGITCVCHSGYFKDGTGVCVGVNVCATNNGGCEAAHGVCTTVVGTWDRTCTCAVGWTGPGANGYYCPPLPVDRCLTNNGGCHVNAVCYNGFALAPVDVTCVCKPNFFATNPSASGPSLVCVGVNVCATNNGGCHADALCTTTVGAWDKTCACKEGFTGNGFYCTTEPSNPGNPGTPGNGWDCPSPPASFWDWRYSVPTCDALTVVYPADLPAGQANDVNVRLHTQGGDVTLNFHNNTGFWSGTTVFHLSAHPNFPTLVPYSVVWTQVGGSNCHWSGSVSCTARVGTSALTEMTSASYAVVSSAGISVGFVGLGAILLVRRRRRQKQTDLNERLALANKSSPDAESGNAGAVEMSAPGTSPAHATVHGVDL